MLTQYTLFFMVILSVSGQSNVTSMLSALTAASTPMPSSSAPGSVLGTPTTSAAATVANTAALAHTSGVSGSSAATQGATPAATQGATPVATQGTTSTAAVSNLAPVLSYTASTPIATPGATTSGGAPAPASSTPSLSSSSVSLSDSLASMSTAPLTSSSRLPSTSGPMSISASTPSTPASASCNITTERATCAVDKCCTGSKGAWTGVNKAANVKYNETVHCNNGTKQSSEKLKSCEHACLNKECDGASAIVVGHVFATCLTFAVFWMIME